MARWGEGRARTSESSDGRGRRRGRRRNSDRDRFLYYGYLARRDSEGHRLQPLGREVKAVPGNQELLTSKAPVNYFLILKNIYIFSLPITHIKKIRR